MKNLFERDCDLKQNLAYYLPKDYFLVYTKITTNSLIFVAVKIFVLQVTAWFSIGTPGEAAA